MRAPMRAQPALEAGRGCNREDQQRRGAQTRADQHQVGLGERDRLRRGVEPDAEAEQDRQDAAQRFGHGTGQRDQQPGDQRTTQHKLVHPRGHDAERHHAEPRRQPAT